MVEVANSTSTVLTANQTIPFTTATFDTNDKIDFDSANNAIVIKKKGNYAINGSFVFVPTASGSVSIMAYANGTVIPYDISTVTATAGDYYTFTLPNKLLKVIQSTYGNTVKITFAVNAAGTLDNALASVSYVE